jgi:mycofactocin system FadH/OYE family oxidoreductase 2
MATSDHLVLSPPAASAPAPPNPAGHRFPTLFSPLRVGAVELANRIVMTAHVTHYGEDHLISQRHVDYYTERIKGGAGLVITEVQGVHPTSTAGFPEVCFAFPPEAVERNAALARSVHAHGGRVFAQLWHSGMHTDGRLFSHYIQPVGPSSLPCTRYREPPREMEEEDIEEVIEGFAASAANLKAAGIDGAEIHMGHSYLIGQFLSPYYNRRTDRWGGSLDNRLRLALAVLDRIWERVGTDWTVGVRISADELVPGGLGLADMQQVCQALVARTRVDFIDCSVGTFNSGAIMVPPMYFPHGVNVHLAAAIRSACPGTPVLAVGRITDPALAEKVLDSGAADLVGMTRALLCDPELPNKARDGRTEEILHCIGCLQACLGRMHDGKAISCLLNPAAGKEREWGPHSLAATAVRRRVVVVGGGPAGMEAARVAAQRGHAVTLLERQSALGGQVQLIVRQPKREEFGEVTRWWPRELERLGVDVRTGCEASAEGILALDPQVVIVATGSVPDKTGFSYHECDRPGMPGAGLPHVLTAWEVLESPDRAGHRVILVDENGSYEAACTADFLAQRGHKVTVVTRWFRLGVDIPDAVIGLLYTRLAKAGAEVRTTAVVREIAPDHVLIENVFSKSSQTEACDSVVLVMGKTPCNRLYRELKGKVPALHLIGDAAAPRVMDQAIYEGHKAGRQA